MCTRCVWGLDACRAATVARYWAKTARALVPAVMSTKHSFIAATWGVCCSTADANAVNFDLGSPLVPISTWEKPRSEEHTSELQSREKLVCRLLLGKKKQGY